MVIFARDYIRKEPDYAYLILSIESDLYFIITPGANVCFFWRDYNILEKPTILLAHTASS